MKNNMLIGVGLVIILCAIMGYFLLPRLIGTILSAGPKKPTVEVPEIYHIGWWAYQDALTVDTFQVDFVESKLNLFNNKSLIKYTIKGHLSNARGWKPIIKNVHVTQRFLPNNSAQTPPISEAPIMPEALIELTPIVHVINDDTYKKENIKFEFTNEIIIESFHWGDNHIRFQCVNKLADLVLAQRK